MPRVKRGVIHVKKRKRILKQTKGYRWGRKNLIRQAITAANRVQDEFANRRSMLDQWAMQRSENINQLRNNMRGITDIAYNQPRFTGLSGTPTTDARGNIRVSGYGGSTDEADRFRTPLYS